MPSGSAIEHRKPLSSSSYQVPAPSEYGSAPSMSARPKPLEPRGSSRPQHLLRCRKAVPVPTEHPDRSKQFPTQRKAGSLPQGIEDRM